MFPPDALIQNVPGTFQRKYFSSRLLRLENYVSVLLMAQPKSTAWRTPTSSLKFQLAFLQSLLHHCYAAESRRTVLLSEQI